MQPSHEDCPGVQTAASDCDGAAERKQVRPGLPDSYEALFHDVGVHRFFPTCATRASESRAIGVVYCPETERVSHYFYTDLPAQFDAILHFDRTVQWSR